MYQVFRNPREEALRGLVDVLFEQKCELLLENSSIIKHLEHLEDLTQTNRERFIATIRGLLQLARQHEGSGEMMVVEKIDGAPALFILIDPRTGTLGVSTKSIGAKAQKIYHSPKELKDVAPGLKEKLEAALLSLRNLPLGGRAFQGDVLFTKSDIRKRRIKGKDYLTFKPNVLMYAVAVDANSELYRKVANSEFGIVIHTVYDVETTPDGNLQLNYTKNPQAIYDLVEKGNDKAGLYMTHPYHPQIKLEVDEKVVADIEKMLAQLEKIKYKIPSQKLREYFNMFVNKQVREGEISMDAVQLAQDFRSYMERKKEEEMAKRKTEKGKESVAAGFDVLITGPQRVDIGFLRVYTLAIKIKSHFIKIFSKVGSKIGETFFEKGEDIESTGPEGFVISSGQDGIVKLVDRGVFSKTNFLFGAFNK
jgi:hypothetical protein